MDTDTAQLVVTQVSYTTWGTTNGVAPCSGPVPLRAVVHPEYSHAGETTCNSCRQNVMVYRLRTPVMYRAPVVKQPLSRAAMRAGLTACLGAVVLLVAGLAAYAAALFTSGFMMFMYAVFCYFVDNRRLPPALQAYVAEPIVPRGPSCCHRAVAYSDHP